MIFFFQNQTWGGGGEGLAMGGKVPKLMGRAWCINRRRKTNMGYKMGLRTTLAQTDLAQQEEDGELTGFALSLNYTLWTFTHPI